jgi:ribose/xylose/arabinose/galactoside ABC-type transport system permease subunit
MSPAFLSAGNLGNVLVHAAPLCLAVLGQSLVIIARGLDLSVGSLMASVAVMATAFESTSNAMLAPIIMSTLAFAAFVGGVVLGGGAGSVLGALLGALILIVPFNIVLILGLPVEAQLVIKGFIIILVAAVHVESVLFGGVVRAGRSSVAF